MVTTSVVYLYSGELVEAGIVGSFDALAKIVLYGGGTNESGSALHGAVSYPRSSRPRDSEGVR